MYLQWFCVSYTRTRSVRCKTTNDTSTPHPILNLLIDVVFCLFFFILSQLSPNCFTVTWYHFVAPDCRIALLLTTFCSSTLLLPRFFVFHRCQGDGFREAFEACDDGNAVSGDGCSEAWIFLKLWRKLYWIARIVDWKQIKKKHILFILYIVSFFVHLEFRWDIAIWFCSYKSLGRAVGFSVVFFQKMCICIFILYQIPSNFPWVWSSV